MISAVTMFSCRDQEVFRMKTAQLISKITQTASLKGFYFSYTTPTCQHFFKVVTIETVRLERVYCQSKSSIWQRCFLKSKNSSQISDIHLLKLSCAHFKLVKSSFLIYTADRKLTQSP